MAISPCGEWEGEVLVDGDGNYAGVEGSWSGGEDFEYGCYPCGGLLYLFAQRWVSPWCFGGDCICPTIGEQLPISPFASWIGSFPKGLTVDTSGPPGLESQYALLVRGSGVAAGNIAYYPGPTDWSPDAGSQWVSQGWVKTTTPACVGASNFVGWATGGAFLRYPAGTITDEWQFFQHVMTISAGPTAPFWPTFGWSGGGFNITETLRIDTNECFCHGEDCHPDYHTFTKNGLYQPHDPGWGDVLYKCLHVYPLGATPIVEFEGVYLNPQTL